jgi:hypothetical protein
LKLAMLFLEFIDDLVGQERGRREYESILSSSSFSASNAYIEKHEAAIFRREPALIVCFKSPPRR